ncbi:MAG: sulfite exporter TauE/SafE family protein [Actinomycetota bacterium]|nr:sulfite exporter TauE/SafE family protein [Actinomycetota bacterium]
MTFLGLLLAIFMGLALGLLGGGGSILAVPILVYAFGFGAKEAVAASLAVVGLTSLFGAAEHWRRDRVRLSVALVFGLFAAVGAYLGAQLAGFLSGAVQLSLFGVVMLIAAFFMLRNGEPDEDGEEAPSEGSVGRLFLRFAAPGIGVGVLTGVVGVGGGFLIVPVLVLLGEIPMAAAVGTSLLVLAMNSFAGFAGYLGKVEIQWGIMSLFAALAVAGSFVGAYLVRFVPQHALKRGFAVFLIVMAVFILYENGIS